MSDIYEVLLKNDGGGTLYSILDKAQKEKADSMALTVADLVNADAQQDEKIAALESAASKFTESDTKTSETLTDHDERITKAQNTADSNTNKYLALSAVVESNAQKLENEIERAKDVEGALDQLETTDKDSLVAAINWVLTKANKGLENVGTLASLTTEEKTDLVSALNELSQKITSSGMVTDTSVLENSANPVSGGSVYAAIKAVKDSIVSTVTDAIDTVKEAIGNATTSAAGLMTTTQVTKLNGIADGATKTAIVNNLTATTAGSALDAVQGKALSDQISSLNSSLTKSTITPTSTSNISSVSIKSYKCGVVTILTFSFSASAAINSWSTLLTFKPPSGLSVFDAVGSMAKAGKFYLQGDSSSRKLQCDVDISSGTWVSVVAICS